MESKLIVFGSSSDGNGYAIKTDKGTLLLECGVPTYKVLEALDYKVEDVLGVCVSHAHR